MRRVLRKYHPQIRHFKSVSPDTVGIRTLIFLKREIQERITNPLSKGGTLAGWEIMTSQRHKDKSEPWRPSQRLHLEHPATGMHLFGSEFGIRMIRVSLPRILFGFNGHMIKSDLEIKMALAQVIELIAPIADIQKDFIHEITRLDVAWTIPIDPMRLLACHQNATVQGIRAVGQSLDHTNLRWKGRMFNLTFYRKREATKGLRRNQELRQIAKSTRIEVQLSHKESVRIRYGSNPDIPVKKITMAGCHRVMANTLLSFESTASESIKYSEIALLALAAASGLKAPGGLNVLDWYRPTVQRETYIKTRKKIQALVFPLTEFTWKDYVTGPEIRAVDIYSNLLEIPFALHVDEWTPSDRNSNPNKNN